MVDTVVINLTPNKVIPPRLRIAINGTEVSDGVIDRARSIRHEIELQDRLNITIHKTGKTKEVVDRKEPQEVLVEESVHRHRYSLFWLQFHLWNVFRK